MARESRRRRSRSSSKSRSKSPSRDRKKRSRRSRSRDRARRSRSKSRDRKSRKRARSRSHERRRSRSRDKKRSRSRSRERRHHRSRSKDRSRRSPHRDKKPRSPSKEEKKEASNNKSGAEKDANEVKQETSENSLIMEQDKLEEEMRRRKERIEKWRQDRKQAELEALKQNPQTSVDNAQKRKNWSLEDDDDEDEDEENNDDEKSEKTEEGGESGEKNEESKMEEEKPEEDKTVQVKIEKNKNQSKEGDEDAAAAAPSTAAAATPTAASTAAADNGVKEEEEDEVDSLDAFMAGVQSQVRQINQRALQAKGVQAVKQETVPTTGKAQVSVITGMVKKKYKPSRGERMEEDADALEYSSEEEEKGLEETMTALMEDKKKKTLDAVDHSRIYYRPFRKDFYVEVPELAKMTDSEVETLRLELENVQIRGKGCPKPVKNWVQCGIHKKVLDSLKRNNYEHPTPIQAQAIPAIMSGRDLIGIAKTGSGKTVAFLLPMLRHIMDQDPLEVDDGPLAIIITPTRELAMQIYKECKRFAKPLGLYTVCVYGGTGISEQIAELKRGCEIVVCTPGRMIDMLSSNNGRVTNLRRCTYIVIDEADRMFDMGFEPQVMRIIDNVRPDRQTVLFSATFPRQMEALARRILTKPVEVQVGNRSVVCELIEQHVVIIEEEQKFLKLLELLGVYQQKGSVLVFVDKQEAADQLLKDLLKASYSCLSLHGGIDQYDRDSIIQDFKSGTTKLLVATSVAARGLDVKELILVVNYNCPNHYEDYVHRVGRTGRAGKNGFSYTFITEDQARYVGDIIKALELSGQSVPAEVNGLWNEFKTSQEGEGKKVLKSSGFGGKGFKFDETEKELASEKKKLEKAALGLQDSDDDDGPMDIDEKIETLFASKKRVKEVPIGQKQHAAANAAGASGLTPLMSIPINKEKLELAKKIAEKVNRSLEGNQDIMQQATTAFMKGGIIAPAVSKKTIAEQLAEKLNAKLNYRPPEEEEPDDSEQADETIRRYEEELEINDFPQTARWKVTSKENLAQIQEYSEAAVTIRGTYVAPGKELKEGDDRKLYLAIESSTELSVQKAKVEITRIIKEELIRLQHSYQPANKGRYKVL